MCSLKMKFYPIHFLRTILHTYSYRTVIHLFIIASLNLYAQVVTFCYDCSTVQYSLSVQLRPTTLVSADCSHATTQFTIYWSTRSLSKKKETWVQYRINKLRNNIISFYHTDEMKSEWWDNIVSIICFSKPATMYCSKVIKFVFK